jgi:thiamine biosynthesis lipoprotein
MGEIRALGSRPDGSPWRVGIEDARDGTELATVLEVEDRAVATSSAEGFRFDATGRFSHLIDPRSGLGARFYGSVAVMALDATAADAFSTAFSLMKPDDVRKIVAGRPELQVRLLENSDPERLLEFGAR